MCVFVFVNAALEALEYSLGYSPLFWINYYQIPGWSLKCLVEVWLKAEGRLNQRLKNETISGKVDKQFVFMFVCVCVCYCVHVGGLLLPVALHLQIHRHLFLIRVPQLCMHAAQSSQLCTSFSLYFRSQSLILPDIVFLSSTSNKCLQHQPRVPVLPR